MKRLRLHGKYGKGKYTLLDDNDHRKALTYSWILTDSGYVRGNITEKHKMEFLHRWLLKPEGKLEVDHKNGNPLDNRRSNLRYSTSQNNKSNTTKTKRQCSSRFKGVCFDKRYKNWISHITYNYKFKHLGNYPTEELAAIVYDFWATYLFGEYAKPNLPIVSTSEKPIGGLNGQMGTPSATAAA